MNLKSYGNTDLGKMRRRNEDTFLADAENHLYAVADGLGGLSAGDRASQTAVFILEGHLRDALKENRPLNFTQAFLDAHRAIQKIGSEADPVRGAGTTLTAAIVREGEIQIAHVGDSAAYLFSADGAKKLTTDHTEAEEFRKQRPGEKVPAIFEHTLTRCLGQPGDVTPDFSKHSFAPGDRLFLCSDGVTREIPPGEIGTLLRKETDPKPPVEELLRLANERGGADNATAVAVFFD